MTGICGASSRLATPHPGSTCPFAPGLGDRGSELVHRACCPGKVFAGCRPPHHAADSTCKAGCQECQVSPGEGLGAGGLCAAVPSRFSPSLSSGKAWAWAAPPRTLEPVAGGGAEAGPRWLLLRFCGGGTVARLVTAEKAPQVAAPWGGDPGLASLLFGGPSLSSALPQKAVGPRSCALGSVLTQGEGPEAAGGLGLQATGGVQPVST